MTRPSPFRRFWHRVLTWSGPLLLLFFAAHKAFEWQTDRFWYEAVNYEFQFDRLMMWRLGAFCLGATLMALWLGINAQLAWRNAARSSVPLAFFETSLSTRLIPIEDKLQLDRFRRRATIFIVAMLSWMMGLGFSTRYTLFVRAFYSQSTGHTDSASNFDLAFFFFQLPLWQWASRFCMVALISSLILVVAIYLYEETIGFTERSPRWSGHAARHLATLWVILLLWKASDCLLSIPLGFVNGGNVATRVFDPLDMKLGWTSSAILALMAPFLAMLSAIAIARQPRYQTFLWGILWMISTRVVPFLLPLVIGRPSEDMEWQNAISRHLTDTKIAWGLDDVDSASLDIKASPAFASITLSDEGSPLPLWPASVVRAAMNRRLEDRNLNLEVGRLSLERENGALYYVGVASAIPPKSESSWRKRHSRQLAGTILRVEANRVREDGGLVLLPDIPSPLLFGPSDINGLATFRRSERMPDAQSFDPAFNAVDDAPWVLVQNAGRDVQGVSLRSFWVRFCLAARFSEFGLLQATPQNRDVVLWRRSAAGRCKQLAPFLDWPESEARPVFITTGTKTKRLVWLVPGLVWSDDYPDSATPAFPGTSPPGVNYGRMSAIGVVDARSGQISLFALNDDEPFIGLYRRAFPKLFFPPTSLSNEIRAQLRPSITLLKAQGLIWSRYHETEPLDWISRKNDWRPLPSLSPSELGDTSLRPLVSQATGDWTVLGFGPIISTTTQSQSESKTSSSSLVGFLGFNERGFGESARMRMVEWRPRQPITLPGIASEPSAITPNGRYVEPQPTLISLAPILDGAGQASGVLATRGELLPPSQNVVTRGVEPPLKLQVNLSGAGTVQEESEIIEAAPSSTPVPQSATLQEAQDAWQDLLEARKAGNWSGVARAEKRLDAVLQELKAP